MSTGPRDGIRLVDVGSWLDDAVFDKVMDV